MNEEVTEMSTDEVNAAFIRLRALKAKIRMQMDKHMQVTTLIGACIHEGFDRGARITGALKKLGYNRQHAGKILTEGTGENPEVHYWKRGEDGRYSVN